MNALVDLFAAGHVVVLTGAGCSTDSGIPDYRGPESMKRARRPMQFREFMGSASARARYWARSVMGWPRISRAVPCGAHRALASLEAGGSIAGIITQNVDRLHHRAESRRVVELHGALADVRCLECGFFEDRERLQARMLDLNPTFSATPAEIAPDGDAELAPDVVDRFRVAPCFVCGGVLKPNVVFFGENVPPQITAEAWSLFDEARALVVAGSSLTVFSGFRFVRRAAERNLPIAIINRGPTRGDPLATIRIDGSVSDVFGGLSAKPILSARRSRA